MNGLLLRVKSPADVGERLQRVYARAALGERLRDALAAEALSWAVWCKEAGRHGLAIDKRQGLGRAGQLEPPSERIPRERREEERRREQRPGYCPVCAGRAVLTSRDWRCLAGCGRPDGRRKDTPLQYCMLDGQRLEGHAACGECGQLVGAGHAHRADLHQVEQDRTRFRRAS